MASSSTPVLPILSFGSIPSPTPSQLPGFPTVVLPNPTQPLPPLPESSLTKKGKQTTSSINESFNLTSTLPDLKHLARTVLNAKRVAVVCGAGISTASGIPDFRSSSGLFESLKHKYPDAKLSSGKDLFDVGLFSSEQNAAIFYNMIAELRKQTDEVEPTKFHHWLKSLDDEGKLFRVYTQNIDALEERAGLTYGLGSTTPTSKQQTKSPKPPTSPSDTLSPPPAPFPSSSQTSTTSSIVSNLSLRRYDSSSSLSSLSSCASSDDSDSESICITPPAPIVPSASSSSASSFPRCIPLHGHLSTLSCALCSTTYPLPPYLPLLSTGQAPLCPSCVSISSARQSQNRRSLGIGYLKPDVVLYGEHHKDGTRIGEITSTDLGKGKRPDLLIVVGTSLKVPGTKKLVKELSKVIKPVSSNGVSAGAGAGEEKKKGGGGGAGAKKRKDKINTVFLNQEFPGGGKEWMGVFDCWVRGDIQEFVEVLEKEREVVEREKAEKEEKTMIGKKIKNSKLPSRPRAPKALPLQTTAIASATSKRRSPPTPTKSPVKKEFYIDVPLPSSSTTMKAPSVPPSTTTTLKRPRRSSPVLSPPLASSNVESVESEGGRRRSGRLSLATAPIATTSTAVLAAARPPPAEKTVGLAFRSTKKGVSSIGEKKQAGGSDDVKTGLMRVDSTSTKWSTRSTSA
ncbi:uncharacterized protein JCM6883_005523 [Sporobolomyces salmoneus]|uniref:uncharacterized protein n=1 Tax=Sporobolomyces salmoneus TaxID=183962 RepID=UPI003178E941